MKTRALIVAGAVMCTALSAPVSALAQAVVDPLHRPAVATRKIDRAVLLGAAAAGARLVAVGERGLIGLSDDQGKSWRQARAVPTSVTLTAVKFVSGTIGWAAGHGGIVLKTSDAGETWVTMLDGVRAAQLMLRHAEAEQVRQSAGAHSLLRQAKASVQDGPDKPFFDIEASDGQHAVVVGATGFIFATADGGATWTPWGDRLDNPKGMNLYAIRRAGRNLVVAGEQGLVLYSDNDGASFARLTGPYAGSWFAVAFESDGGFVLAGLRGNAYRVGTHGKTWTRLDGLTPLSLTTAVSAGSNCTLLANQGGQLFSLRTSDIRAARLGSGSLPPVTAMVRQADGAWLGLTMAGITPIGKLGNACSSSSSPDSGKP